MFLNTKVVKELYYREYCSDGTSCIKAFTVRHKARHPPTPASLPQPFFRSAGKPLAGRALGPAGSSRHSSPRRCRCRRKPGLSPPLPRHCGAGVGSQHAPHPAPHLERSRGAGRAPAEEAPARPVAQSRTHTHTDTESGARGGARGGAGGGRVTCSASPGGGWCIC